VSVSTSRPDDADVIVIGGGASGLMCAISAGFRGRRVLVLEKGPKCGLKILVSGGGRCNFTHLDADPREHYLSENPHFCLSAMRRFTPRDFLAMVEAAGIAYHEKTPGQLFCDNSAQDILDMLLQQCEMAGVTIRLREAVESLRPGPGGGFEVRTASRAFTAPRVVLACGGLSLPKIASDLAFRVARQFDLEVVSPRAALVPLTWNNADREQFAVLSGISLPVRVRCGTGMFHDQMLFTHRGLSGPAILQISSYWREGDSVVIDLLPDCDARQWLAQRRNENPRQSVAGLLREVLPRRLVDVMRGPWFDDGRLGSLSAASMAELGARLNHWEFRPGGSEGYRTAEVTLGGIDTKAASSKTFEIEALPGLYAIGEALDVTGWLGGYNFQWAWASGWCCGQAL
jgi:predicted Rossmann fold flavoprotein